MEEEGLELVLAKATELRFKISDCIHKANSTTTDSENQQLADKDGSFNRDENPNSHGPLSQKGEKQEHEEEDDEEETEKLLNIREAFESLEAQLVILQNLQQQQRYEKELALKEIEYWREMLLEKLKEYKGKDLEVLHEASAFAGETVGKDSDLLLPPYPSRPPRSLVLDTGYLSHLQEISKLSQNGIASGQAKSEAKKSMKDCGSRNRGKGLGNFISSAARMILPVVGAIYLLSLSGLARSENGRKSIPSKLCGLFQQPTSNEKHSFIRCPPGKVLVMEGGEARCLVKERVEIPFDSDVAKPDVNYGCG